MLCRHWACSLHARRAAGSGEVLALVLLPLWQLSLFLDGFTPRAEWTADHGSGPGGPLKCCCVEAECVDQLTPLRVG